jgi:DNA-directed RNA polymerase subunit RPC12/RpoP
MTSNLETEMNISEQHTIQCPQCGGTQFEQPQVLSDDEWVTCVTCAQSFPVDDIRQVGLDQARNVVIPEIKTEVEKMLKGLFKGKFK